MALAPTATSHSNSTLTATPHCDTYMLATGCSAMLSPPLQHHTGSTRPHSRYACLAGWKFSKVIPTAIFCSKLNTDITFENLHCARRGYQACALLYIFRYRFSKDISTASFCSHWSRRADFCKHPPTRNKMSRF